MHESAILFRIKEMEKIGTPEVRIRVLEKFEETNLCPQVQF